MFIFPFFSGQFVGRFIVGVVSCDIPRHILFLESFIVVGTTGVATLCVSQYHVVSRLAAPRFLILNLVSGRADSHRYNRLLVASVAWRPDAHPRFTQNLVLAWRR
jgi:hypothetical protein